MNHEVTHLVVKSLKPPFTEYLVPIDNVTETTPKQIKLKCTRNEMENMKRFEDEETIYTEFPTLLNLYYVVCTQVVKADVVTYDSETYQSVPQDELAICHSAKVAATDGYIGKINEVLINSINMQVTYLVLREGHVFKNREVTIPISQIDHVDEDTIYLKLDRQTVEGLPTIPTQRWQLHDKRNQLSFSTD
ncbi:MAG TPA: PRC-barrel domain-containing protein [Anaerolineaceae bacterium]|nr:PRC-barrel domain-containing protein [Anaerolineaceae bacterium]